MLDLFVYNKLNFKACVSALFLKNSDHFITHKVCKLILLKDGLFWLSSSARVKATKRALTRFNNCQLLVCCTRDFAKALVFCALLPLGINCGAQYYSHSDCSENFSVSKFETGLCSNPLVRIQINDVVNVF